MLLAASGLSLADPKFSPKTQKLHGEGVLKDLHKIPPCNSYMRVPPSLRTRAEFKGLMSYIFPLSAKTDGPLKRVLNPLNILISTPSFAFDPPPQPFSGLPSLFLLRVVAAQVLSLHSEKPTIPSVPPTKTSLSIHDPSPKALQACVPFWDAKLLCYSFYVVSSEAESVSQHPPQLSCSTAQKTKTLAQNEHLLTSSIVLLPHN